MRTSLERLWLGNQSEALFRAVSTNHTSLQLTESRRAIRRDPGESNLRRILIIGRTSKSRFVAQQQIEKLQMLYDSLAQEYFGD